MHNGLHLVAFGGLDQRGQVAHVAAHETGLTGPELEIDEIRARFRIEEDDRLAACHRLAGKGGAHKACACHQNRHVSPLPRPIGARSPPLRARGILFSP